MERNGRKGVREEGFERRADTIEASFGSGSGRRSKRSLRKSWSRYWARAGCGGLVCIARTGYRHGVRGCLLTTNLGRSTIMLPGVRLKGADGVGSDSHSRVIWRDQRRNERGDGTPLGTDLSAISTRRLRQKPIEGQWMSRTRITLWFCG
jgi:hypothetical protein